VVQNFRDFYDKTESFTAHLRALETYLAEHPTSAPARFLLGYQYAYLGYEAQALAQLEQAQQLMPRDRVIGQLIERVRAGAKKVPANPGAAEF
jgi:cytochrome c-type biogenesis protein CcmH/NrfG